MVAGSNPALATKKIFLKSLDKYQKGSYLCTVETINILNTLKPSVL
jgi:hypothetical protein